MKQTDIIYLESDTEIGIAKATTSISGDWYQHMFRFMIKNHYPLTINFQEIAKLSVNNITLTSGGWALRMGPTQLNRLLLPAMGE